MNDENNEIDGKMRMIMNYCTIAIIIIAALSFITIISMMNFSSTEDVATENIIENKTTNETYASTTRNTVKKKDYMENKALEEAATETETEDDTPSLDALLKEMNGLYITAYNNRIEVVSSPYQDYGTLAKATYYFDENNYVSLISFYFNYAPVAEENVSYADYCVSLFEDVPDVVIDEYEVTFDQTPSTQVSRDELIQNYESNDYVVRYAE